MAMRCDSDHAPRSCGCTLSRRTLLATAATVIASAARAQPAPGIIDVHHHLAPPAYLAALRGAPISPPMLKWTIEQSLADMDRAGIGTAMLSITAPGLWLTGTAAADLARTCNDYGAELGRAHPGRFGSFAALPLPDIDASLKEIERALDVLHADGVLMFTSYGNKWLGDPHFAPVMDELNRRRAIVYTHPYAPACCVNLVPGIPDPAIEYGTDTTRTIASLVFAGAARRWPGIRFIFSHAGGTMPFLIERFEFLARTLPAANRFDVRADLAHFYYDTAQASNPVAMGALRQIAPISQIVFGTDYPFRTSLEHVEGLNKSNFSEPDLAAIKHGNAAAMFAPAR